MEEVKYIPGDLVIHYGVKSVIDIVSCSQKRDDVCYGLHHLDGNNTSYQSFKKGQLVPIPLTPAILENSGWKTQNKWYYFLEIRKGFISDIGIDFIHKSPNNNLYVEVNGNNMAEIQYCHQLQHLLFGFGFDSSLNV